MPTAEDYKKALEAACREYEEVSRQRADLDKRLAYLHETIGALTRLCGYTPTVPWGLTDAIRVVLMRAEQPMTPIEVRDRLRAIGFDLSKYANDLAAIHTVLKRLNKAGEIHLVPREPGVQAYRRAKVGTVVLDPADTHHPYSVFFDIPKRTRSRK